MKTLEITNESGTLFNYSIDENILNIDVIKNGLKVRYKAIKSNKINDGVLIVQCPDGSKAAMPVFEAEKVEAFKDGRTKHSFCSVSEMREFKANNKCGDYFTENGKFSVYKYL